MEIAERVVGSRGAGGGGGAPPPASGSRLSVRQLERATRPGLPFLEGADARGTQLDGELVALSV
jgi:hypothetical protein